MTVIAGNLDKVRAINQRYARPRLTISPAVRVCLLVLRLYLLFLVGLLAMGAGAGLLAAISKRITEGPPTPPPRTGTSPP